jgi:hypothetical protein
MRRTGDAMNLIIQMQKRVTGTISSLLYAGEKQAPALADRGAR